MRRQDREIKDRKEIKNILEHCAVCHLGLIENGMPYVVPMNYGYSLTETGLTLYFHCAGEGKKFSLLRENPEVSFAIDRELGLLPSDVPCQFSMAYESIMGYGRARFLLSGEEKLEALQALMRHYSGREWGFFDPAALGAITAFAVDAAEYTAKRRPLPENPTA